MSIVEEKFQNEQQKISDKNAEVLSNFFRCLTMLETTLERLARHRWYRKNQYPEIYFEILSTICWLRTWAKDYKVFSGISIVDNFLKNVNLSGLFKGESAGTLPPHPFCK